MNQIRPPNMTIDEDTRFFSHYWTSLAAAGWEGYSHLGRGAVVIDRTNGPTPFVFYLDTSLAGGYDSWPVSRLHGILGEYDPLREIVCVVVRSDENIALYRVHRRRLTPPQAYAKTQPVQRGLTA
jgi:hypothetical protein